MSGHRRPIYFSQWGDLACNEPVIVAGVDPAELHDWAADGYNDPESYRRWSRNTCGIACLQSVLSLADAFGLKTKADLIAGAVRWGALVPRDDGAIDGLFYAPFVEWVTADYGLQAHTRADLPIGDLTELLANDWLVIASVSSEIRRPDLPATRRGGHLVLAFDVKDEVITFHNPSGLPGTADSAECRIPQFREFYAGRGIAIRRSR